MESVVEKGVHARIQKQSRIAFETFYEMVEENVKADLIDGMIIQDSPAVPRHAQIVTWLIRFLGSYVEQYNLGEILCAPTTVRLSQYQAPEPDVFFIAKSRSLIIGDQYVDGVPDLCIEVVSKSSRRLDRGRKFVLYADYGVREYWIIDPLSKIVEFFHNYEGKYNKIAPDKSGRLHSQVLNGFWLKPDWLLGDPLVRVSDALNEIITSEAMSGRF